MKRVVVWLCSLSPVLFLVSGYWFLVNVGRSCKMQFLVVVETFPVWQALLAIFIYVGYIYAR